MIRGFLIAIYLTAGFEIGQGIYQRCGLYNAVLVALAWPTVVAAYVADTISNQPVKFCEGETK